MNDYEFSGFEKAINEIVINDPKETIIKLLLKKHFKICCLINELSEDADKLIKKLNSTCNLERIYLQEREEWEDVENARSPFFEAYDIFLARNFEDSELENTVSDLNTKLEVIKELSQKQDSEEMKEAGLKEYLSMTANLWKRLSEMKQYENAVSEMGYTYQMGYFIEAVLNKACHDSFGILILE